MDVEVKKRTRTRDAIKNTSLTTWIIEKFNQGDVSAILYTL